MMNAMTHFLISRRYPPRKNHRGFAAVAAIFLIVILASLGAFMVTFSNTQQLTSAQDFQGSRAYWAANAGLEWAVVAIPSSPSSCPAATLTEVIGGPALVEGFSVKIFCAQNTYVEGGASLTIYRFESQASMGTVGAIGYIERSVSATMEK